MVFFDLVIMLGLLGALVVPCALIIRMVSSLFLRHGGDEHHGMIDRVQTEERPAQRQAERLDDLPGDVAKRVDRIRSYAAENLARLEGDASRPIADEIRRLRDDHLPDLLRAYERIPAGHRGDALGDGGGTATDRLKAGLDGMTARLDEIEAALSRGSIDAFADATRFVEARYGAGRQQI